MNLTEIRERARKVFQPPSLRDATTSFTIDNLKACVLSDIPALCDEIERLEGEKAKLRKKLLGKSNACVKMEWQKELPQLCNRTQNEINKPVRSTSKTGFKGVHLIKSTGRFEVQAKFRGKHIRGGNFKNKIEAAKKYNEIVKSLHGEYAWLNPV